MTFFHPVYHSLSHSWFWGVFTLTVNQSKSRYKYKSRYSHVVGRLNILNVTASFAREIHFTTDANLRHGRGFCHCKGEYTVRGSRGLMVRESDL